jgi:hypothetical protein
MDASVNIRALRLAARLVGGPAKLRDALGVSSAEVADWLAGTQEPPREILLRAVDLILDDLDRQEGG